MPCECHLLITFANRLDPDQVRQYVGSNLDPICLTVRGYSSKNCFEIVDFENKTTKKKTADDKKNLKISKGGKELILLLPFYSTENQS